MTRDREWLFLMAGERGYPRTRHPSPMRPEFVGEGEAGWRLFCERASSGDVAALIYEFLYQDSVGSVPWPDQVNVPWRGE